MSYTCFTLLSDRPFNGGGYYYFSPKPDYYILTRKKNKTGLFIFGHEKSVIFSPTFFKIHRRVIFVFFMSI